MRQNKGYTLIELIIVIAILAVLAGVAGISYGAVSGSKVKSCAKQIESILNKARVTTMGKDEVTVRLYVDSSGNYYMDTYVTTKGKTTTTTTTTKKVGGSDVIIKYSVNDNYSSLTELTSSNDVWFCFDRSSGALKNISDAKKSGQRVVVCKKNGNGPRTITIYKETGNVELD